MFLLERAGGHLSVTGAKRGQAGDRVDSGTWQPISPYSACTAHVERHLRSPGLLWLTTGLQLQRARKLDIDHPSRDCLQADENVQASTIRLAMDRFLEPYRRRSSG